MTTSVPIFSPNLVPMLTGFVPTIVDATHITLTPGMCSDSFARNYIIANEILTINTAVVGAGGVDIGPIVEDSLYAILAVDSSIAQENSVMTNGQGVVNGMLSLAGTLAAPLSPVLPTINVGGILFATDEYRVVGYALTDPSGNLLPGIWTGQNNERSFSYATGISVLSGGSSTTFAHIDLVNSEPNAIVPLVCNVELNYAFTPNASGDTFAFLTTGVTSTNGMQIFSGPTAAHPAEAITTIPVGSDTGVPSVDYKVTASGALTVLVAGYSVSL